MNYDGDGNDGLKLRIDGKKGVVSGGKGGNKFSW
jgi:hypothetical protein